MLAKMIGAVKPFCFVAFTIFVVYVQMLSAFFPYWGVLKLLSTVTTRVGG
jgi:hypothetical protein